VDRFAEQVDARAGLTAGDDKRGLFFLCVQVQGRARSACPCVSRGPNGPPTPGERGHTGRFVAVGRTYQRAACHTRCPFG
jgi:hypothetical protein